MTKRRKLSKKKIILFLIIILFILVFIISLLKIFGYLKDNGENEKIKESLSKSITIIKDDDLLSLTDQYKVDFEELKKQNSDVVAYLKVNSTNIDYVVVKGTDNSYYLNHNFNSDYNVSGWIFADYHNKFDGSDKNIVIFGHNTYDGSMFGTLKNILNDSWQSDSNNHQVLLITDHEVYLYKVFSVYSISSEDYYMNTIFTSNNEYLNFLNAIKARSLYDFNIDVREDDKILTLSTCTASGTGRVVLHAKMIEN